MKYGIFLTTQAAALALTLGCGSAQQAAKDPGAAAEEEEAADAPSGASELVGKPAPQFNLKSVGKGKSVSISGLKGKVVIVDFWATWCDPCRESFPGYEKLAQEFKGTLTVIGVSVDEEPDGIEAFRESTGVKFPLVWDEGGKVAEAYGPPKMPTSYVIDQKGVVRHVHAGFTTEEEAKLRDEVAALIGD